MCFMCMHNSHIVHVENNRSYVISFKRNHERRLFYLSSSALDSRQCSIYPQRSFLYFLWLPNETFEFFKRVPSSGIPANLERYNKKQTTHTFPPFGPSTVVFRQLWRKSYTIHPLLFHKHIIHIWWFSKNEEKKYYIYVYSNIQKKNRKITYKRISSQ